MSGTAPPTPFSGFAGGNSLMPQRPVAPAVPQMPAQPQAPQGPMTGTQQTRLLGPAPPPRILQALQMRHIHAATANDDQDTMIRKRDVAGRELSKLAEVANTPDNNRADLVAYIGKLSRTGDVTPEEAAQLLQGLPQDQTGIRQWAREMFGNLMNVAVHAHAAYPRSLFPGNGGNGQAPEPEAPEQEGQQP